MKCKWCYKYNYPECGKPYRECSVFGPNIPLKYAIEGGCNCTEEFIEVLYKNEFKELCNKLDAEDVINQAIDELYSEHLMLKAIDSKELTIEFLAHSNKLLPIHFCRPEEIEEKEVYIYRGKHYGDSYAGMHIDKYVFDIYKDEVHQYNSDFNIVKRLSTSDITVAWFFADKETLVFIGNGNIYETFKQEGKKFDTGIFSDKPGIIKRVLLYTPKIAEDKNSKLGLDLARFNENWEQLPECIDLLQRMIELEKK